VKRFLTHASVIGALTLAVLLGHIAPSAADGYSYAHRYRHHVRVAYVPASPYYGECRIGWWQTLRYGHVHPTWAEFCR
jgi:hypothetical protein